MIRRFPIYIQTDAMLCGATCLRMISSFYGIKYSLEFLTEFCQASNIGVSLKGVNDAAKKIGFDTVNCRATIEELKSSSLPSILHWRQNHYVVLYKISKDGYFYIADPSKGKFKLKQSEFEKNWISTLSNNKEKGIVMFLTPNNNFGLLKESEIKSGRNFSFLWNYVIQYKKYFINIFTGLILGCILQLIMPFLTQSIVDIGIKHEDISLIWLILIGELFIVIGKVSIEFIRRWMLLHISTRINLSLISDFFIKLLKLPMSYFDTKVMGDILQRIGDHGRIQSFLTGQMLNTVFSGLSFLILGFILFLYSKLIFVTFFVGSILYGMWMVIFLKSRKLLDYELFERQADSNSKTYQFITSMQEIKLQGCENRRRCEWENVQVELFNVHLKLLKINQLHEIGAVLINEIKNIMITVLAASAVIDSNMTLGAMLAIQYIIGQLESPVNQVMSLIYTLQDVKISLERIKEVHMKNNEETVCIEKENIVHDKSIEFRNVDFKYDIHALENTLENISFKISANKITAIVGSSGSGKSTLIKLMLGYYKTNKGEIYISGKSISGYNLKQWRSKCGVVMQDGIIFSESIARNIAVGDEDIVPEMLEKAARIAEIHEYIESLPLGYNTKIGRDGKGISQGQRQRILIARAVYKNPDFIFFDEATNSLDAKNERLIVENLYEYYKGKTVVIVAHRLSTVKNADNIIVLDKGKVVETGNHDNLTVKRGLYYSLVKNQLELGD